MTDGKTADDRLAPPEGRLPDFSEDGVDLTLIRWMLSLTPTERLRVLERNVAAILRLRGARTERDTVPMKFTRTTP